MTLQDGTKVNIILIDTEGFGSVENDKDYDVVLYFIALLMSSHTVLNVKTNIDREAIKNLSLVKQVAERFK